MADNTLLNAGTGGDTVRDVDKSGVKTPVVLLDIGATGTEDLFTGVIKATVSDALETYIAGEERSLSITSDGRLRVMVEAYDFASWSESDLFGTEVSGATYSAW